MLIVLALVLGGFFGYALYYTGASSPRNIVSMLRLRDLTLMKIIVFAIGLASFLLSIFGLFGIINLNHLSVKATNLGVITGGLLFGLGFGTVGTCPGTCVAAVGSGGYKKAFAALVGGLVGAWLFSMTYGFWKNVGLFSTMNLGKVTLFKISDKFASVFSFGFPGLLIVSILFMAAAFLLPNGKDA